jgi:hypothetical protein
MEKQTQIEEIKNILYPLGFVLHNNRFVNKNLLVYFRESHQEWRLKDCSAYSSEDLIKINYPFNEAEQLRVKEYCSEFYREDEVDKVELYIRHQFQTNSGKIICSAISSTPSD